MEERLGVHGRLPLRFTLRRHSPSFRRASVPELAAPSLFDGLDGRNPFGINQHVFLSHFRTLSAIQHFPQAVSRIAEKVESYTELLVHTMRERGQVI